MSSPACPGEKAVVTTLLWSQAKSIVADVVLLWCTRAQHETSDQTTPSGLTGCGQDQSLLLLNYFPFLSLGWTQGVLMMEAGSPPPTSVQGPNRGVLSIPTPPVKAVTAEGISKKGVWFQSGVCMYRSFS